MWVRNLFKEQCYLFFFRMVTSKWLVDFGVINRALLDFFRNGIALGHILHSSYFVLSLEKKYRGTSVQLIVFLKSNSMFTLFNLPFRGVGKVASLRICYKLKRLPVFNIHSWYIHNFRGPDRMNIHKLVCNCVNSFRDLEFRIRVAIFSRLRNAKVFVILWTNSQSTKDTLG